VEHNQRLIVSANKNEHKSHFLFSLFSFLRSLFSFVCISFVVCFFSSFFVLFLSPSLTKKSIPICLCRYIKTIPLESEYITTIIEFTKQHFLVCLLFYSQIIILILEHVVVFFFVSLQRLYHSLLLHCLVSLINYFSRFSRFFLFQSAIYIPMSV